MQLIDTKAVADMATSYFLTRAEFKELYPHRQNSRINYMFKHEVPKDVPDGEAKLLMKKFTHILLWEKVLELPTSNRHQELEKMKYNDLKKYAGSIKMPIKDMRVKRAVLINNIVSLEIAQHTLKEKAKALKRDGVKTGDIKEKTK